MNIGLGGVGVHHLGVGKTKNIHPWETNKYPLKRDVISVGNASDPTIDFQGTFVSFQGSMFCKLESSVIGDLGVTLSHIDAWRFG